MAFAVARNKYTLKRGSSHDTSLLTGIRHYRKFHRRPCSSVDLEKELTCGYSWRNNWTSGCLYPPWTSEPLWGSPMASLNPSISPSSISQPLPSRPNPPNTAVSKTGAAFLLNWLPQLFHFIIWNLRKRWSAPNSWLAALSSASSIIRNYKLMLAVCTGSLYCTIGRFMSWCRQHWWNKLNWAWKGIKIYPAFEILLLQGLMAKREKHSIQRQTYPVSLTPQKKIFVNLTLRPLDYTALCFHCTKKAAGERPCIDTVETCKS